MIRVKTWTISMAACTVSTNLHFMNRQNVNFFLGFLLILFLLVVPLDTFRSLQATLSRNKDKDSNGGYHLK